MVNAADKDASKIEFPCEGYPIKVVGRSTDDFCDWVVQCVNKYAPELSAENVVVVPSRHGNFQSIRFSIYATNEAQLKNIHEDLMASGRVQMVI